MNEYEFSQSFIKLYCIKTSTPVFNAWLALATEPDVWAQIDVNCLFNPTLKNCNQNIYYCNNFAALFELLTSMCDPELVTKPY
jgi:hypothetical protein